MDSCPLKYRMANKWLSNACLSKARGESFVFHMNNAGYYICDVCGYVVDGAIPDKCPVCGSDAKVFFEAK
jgi:rubrerythrin